MVREVGFKFGFVVDFVLYYGVRFVRGVGRVDGEDEFSFLSRDE